MLRVLKSIRAWLRPRARDSFFRLWWRQAVFLAPIVAILQPFFHRPWFGAIVDTLWYTLIFALAQYGYFHVYGGTDEEFPDPPKDLRFPW